MSSVAESFQAGLRMHQAGDISGAEEVYRFVLAEQPEHAADANSPQIEMER